MGRMETNVPGLIKDINGMTGGMQRDGIKWNGNITKNMEGYDGT